jgi:TolB-like protein/Tfp pilus assembly protein PilF/predicted Ser/Thr protein kinase
MDPQRWRDVSRVFQLALDVSPQDRSRFLAEACGGDDALRAEVLSLLERDDSGTPVAALDAIRAAAEMAAMSRASTTQLVPGATLGSYRIERQVGQGGMGAVFLAYDTRLRRRVALKVLRADGSGSARKLVHEARSAAALTHPNICTVYEVAEIDGTPFIAMEYVDGQSLRTRLDAGALPPDQLLDLALQAAAALACAHDHGVVHRDFKAANAIVTDDGRLKIVDFGLAKRGDPGGTGTTAVTLVPSGVAAGTPASMAPEQVRGEPADARTDVWALGVLLYEMAAGTRPFGGETAAELFSAILRDAPAPLPAGVPSPLAAITERCLQKDPARRYQRAGEVHAALQVVRTRGVHDRRPRRLGGAAGRVAAALAAVGLLVAVLAGDRWLPRPPTARSSPAFTSLAVLPLEDLSPDREDGYFAAGMHEALIVGLGKLRGLQRVIARPSVQRYRTIDRPLAAIAGELGVEALITGTVLRSGDRVRITAQLVDPASERQLWGESYERELRDVLALQNDVVAAIAEQIRLRLSPDERVTLATSRRVNPDAYQAYLKGVFQLNALTPKALDAGIALLRDAAAFDPAEPLAYAGLARGYSLREVFSPTTSRDDSERARAAAQKAAALDPGLAEAHTAVATYKFAKEWDYAGAERSFRRALEINPSLAETHITYAQFLSIFGSEDEAIAEWQRGVALDPLSPLYAAWFANAYWESGRLDDAIREAERSLSIQPDFPVGLFVKGLVHSDRGEHQAAIALHEAFVAKYPRQAGTWMLARTYALAGRTAEARTLLARAGATPEIDLPHPWFLAAAHTALGEYDEAMNWLDRAYDLRIGFLTNIARDRAAGFDLRPLRSHPRFQALLEKMNPTRTGRSAG